MVAVTPEMVYPPSYFAELKRAAPDYFVLPDFDARATDPLAAYAAQLLKAIELPVRWHSTFVILNGPNSTSIGLWS